MPRWCAYHYMAAYDPNSDPKFKESVDVLKSVAPNVKAVEKGHSEALFTNGGYTPAGASQNPQQKIEKTAEANKDVERFSAAITKDNFNR
jgi:hypothetical protein